MVGTRTTYIEPGAPWENPVVGSFNRRVRDELLNIEDFANLFGAQIAEDWRIVYNIYRPTAASSDAPRRTRGTVDQPTPTPNSHSNRTDNMVRVTHACVK